MNEDEVQRFFELLEELIEMTETTEWKIIPHPEALENLYSMGFTEQNIQELFLGEGEGWEMWLSIVEEL